MINTKKAVEMLLNRCSASFKGDYINLFSVEETKLIADLIEQQEKELTLLREQRKEEIKMRLLAARIKKGEIVVPLDAIVFADSAEDIDRRMKECEKWEQYAELGQLALTTRAKVCSNNDFIKRGAKQCEKHCTNYKYCKLRFELLVEGSK